MAEKFPLVPVVLCGGSGSRLWPRSRANLPKPFIAMPDGGGALLDRTFARIAEAPAPPAAVMTAVAAEHAFLCEESFSAHGPDAPHWIVAEPLGRDTGAAVAMAAEICRKRISDDAILLVLPADHLIADSAGFWNAAARATASARAGNFALLGIAPDHAATGYGYIRRGEKTADGGSFQVSEFVEKPTRARAEAFLQSGNYFWNAGVFCFAAGTLHSALPAVAPDLAAPLARATAGAERFAKAGTTVFSPDKTACESFPAISFDRAVMEKVGGATVADAAGIGWSDVGSWRTLGATVAADENGNRVCGEAILEGAENCVIVGGGRLIAAVDVRGLHIVDSPDALLVSSEAGTERTREVFAKLRGRAEAEEAATVRRPWGSYTVLAEGAGGKGGGGGFKVKRIDVSPGAKLSLQSHRHRSEHWTTVIGTMTVTAGGREFAMAANESCFIPRGSRHRMANLTDAPAAVVEVQVGDYLGEDDIVRHEDIYGRA